MTIQVQWKPGMTPSTLEPLEVKYIETATGSRISADLLVPVGSGVFPPEDMGLMEIVEAQIDAIGELEKQLKLAKGYADTHTLKEDGEKELKDLKEWADQFPYLMEDLCVALGFARNPVGPTGIPELDIVLDLMR